MGCEFGLILTVDIQVLMTKRFLWVDLQIKNICDIERHHTEADVRAELGKLPWEKRMKPSSIRYRRTPTIANIWL